MRMIETVVVWTSDTRPPARRRRGNAPAGTGATLLVVGAALLLFGGLTLSGDLPRIPLAVAFVAGILRCVP